jgi:hypothetical protein
MATDAAAQKRRANSELNRPSRPRSPWWRRFERAFFSTAILGAIIVNGPNWLEQFNRWREDLPQKHVVDPVDKGKLYEKNLACTSAPTTWFTIPTNIRMSSTVCDSGDVFVHATTPGHDYYGWLQRSDIIPALAASGGLIPSARAATLQSGAMITGSAQAARIAPIQVQQVVICQRFLNSRYLLRRVRTGRGCVDQTVDRYLPGAMLI